MTISVKPPPTASRATRFLLGFPGNLTIALKSYQYGIRRIWPLGNLYSRAPARGRR